jgi:hypothetical protein
MLLFQLNLRYAINMPDAQNTVVVVKDVGTVAVVAS